MFIAPGALPRTLYSLGRPSIAFYSQLDQTLCVMKKVGTVYELYHLAYQLEMYPSFPLAGK